MKNAASLSVILQCQKEPPLLHSRYMTFLENSYLFSMILKNDTVKKNKLTAGGGIN